MTLKQCVRFQGLPKILLGRADLMLLMKAQITRKKINLPKLFFVKYVRASTSSPLQYFIWLKSKAVKLYLVVPCAKLL